MAERPIFLADFASPGLVKQVSFEFLWHGGFSASQKKKNVDELHLAAQRFGYGRILEVSSKSEESLGQRLSAFSLRIKNRSGTEMSLESAFQGSKLFELGGPYNDLYAADARTAKKDPRLRESGRLLGFTFDDFLFPLEPKTVFYDWLYINALLDHRVWLQRLERYDGFTDIEFNPDKSLNCQAKSCALFVALMRMDLLDDDLRIPAKFIALMESFSSPQNRLPAMKRKAQMGFPIQ